LGEDGDASMKGQKARRIGVLLLWFDHCCLFIGRRLFVFGFSRTFFEAIAFIGVDDLYFCFAFGIFI
jgi:hypothetical protein